MQRLFTVAICLIWIMNIAQAQTIPQLIWEADRMEALEGDLFYLRLTQKEPTPEDWTPNSFTLEYIHSHLQDQGFQLVRIPQTLLPTHDPSEKIFWEGYVYQVRAGQFSIGESLILTLESSEESTQTVEVETQPVDLRIRALPPTQLPTAQCVGDFSLSYGFSKGKEKGEEQMPTYLTGELFYLAIRVEGEGNVSLAPAPLINFSDSFLVSGPVSQVEWQRKEGKLWGQKTFRYEVQGAFTGDYPIGPAQFLYFSPSTLQYDSLSTPVIQTKIIGKDIPQLLKVNQLNRFYQEKMKRGETEPPFRVPYPHIILWICMGISLALLLWGFIQELIQSRRSGL
ncbi:MAG: hypothetical protein AAFR59_10505 [Bacteroidota bacterium]